jgi:hypothetical protein
VSIARFKVLDDVFKQCFKTSARLWCKINAVLLVGVCSDTIEGIFFLVNNKK